MLEAMDRVEEALRLAGREDWRREWLEVLASLTGKDSVHGLLRGRFVRVRHDSGTLDEGGLHAASRFALSTAVPAAQAAAWLTGLLRGGAVSLLHEDGVWRALDRWLRELTPEVFNEAVPLVRRAFSTFQGPELRAMGERVRLLSATIDALLGQMDQADGGAAQPPPKPAARRKRTTPSKARS